MTSRSYSTAMAAAVVALLSMAGVVRPSRAARVTPPPPPNQSLTPACARRPPRFIRCEIAFVRPDDPPPGPGTVFGLARLGYGPADLQLAYGLTKASATRGGQTVAVVDAFDDPKAESDLAVYRSYFHLPPCTRANGCFHKVNQDGDAHIHPAPDAGWAVEISLDLDMASAICPLCHLLLVEANQDNDDSMYNAVDTAARLATVVSLSWGQAEFPNESTLDPALNHPGIPIVAAAGDTNGTTFYPAASPYVVAVGGTRLERPTKGQGWTERAWNITSSGCSAYEPKPSWQHDPLCPRRTQNDVAAVAFGGGNTGPTQDSGVATYDSYAPPTDPGTYETSLAVALGGGWYDEGGTSASAPIIAGVFALAGNAGGGPYASGLYLHRTQLRDIISGSTGLVIDGDWPPTIWPIVVSNCGNYLCEAKPGYDGPTGWGTPNGIGAF